MSWRRSPFCGEYFRIRIFRFFSIKFCDRSTVYSPNKCSLDRYEIFRKGCYTAESCAYKYSKWVEQKNVFIINRQRENGASSVVGYVWHVPLFSLSISVFLAAGLVALLRLSGCSSVASSASVD